jgi:serine/threonine protein kinase
MIHRDVKPANILYSILSDGVYQFQLADFGLCNHQADAGTWDVGTMAFMAPEMVRQTRDQQINQSPKVEVWSLYVTMAWVFNLARYRERTRFSSYQDVHDAIIHAASSVDDSFPTMRAIPEMVIVDPHQRASAAQMLVKLYGNRGLSTLLTNIAPLFQTPPSFSAHSPLPCRNLQAAVIMERTENIAARALLQPSQRLAHGNIFEADARLQVNVQGRQLRPSPMRA